MSKYIYATVYEQFTGLKPPEPKSHKPRRRRGYGHPYRMRLNMQENEQDTEERNEEENGVNSGLIGGTLENSDSINSIDHKYDTARFNDSFDIASANSGNTTERSMKPRSDRARNRTYNRSAKSIFSNTATLQSPAEEKSARAPKVTYKKRRHLLDKGDTLSDA